jgi:diguanylate cyclase (GGDEF)-like protein
MDLITLIATNDERARNLLDLSLGSSYNLIQARSIREMLDAFQSKPVDIAIVDEVLDGRPVSELLPEIFEISKYVVVLVMAEDAGAGAIADALRQGAHDTIPKPIDKYKVTEKIERTARLARLLGELRVGSEHRKERLSTLSLPIGPDASRAQAAQASFPPHGTGQPYGFLGKLAEAATSIRDTKKLFGLIVEAATDVLTVNQAALVLVEEDGYRLSVRASRGLDEEFLNQIKFSVSEGIYSWLWKNSRILFTDEAEHSAGMEELEAIRKEAKILQAKLCIPLGLKRKPFGYLSLGGKFTGEPYRKEELESTFTLSGYASAAIENALTFGRYKELSTTDELTRLYNRRYCKKYLEDEIDRSKRYDRPLSVAIFDIDHFKSINDTLGHPAGDEVLKAVAGFLLKCSRGTDVVGRWGGEEFIVILPETEAEVAYTYCERVRLGVAEQLGKREGEQFVHTGLTISGGVATFEPATDTFETIIERADRALYSAKRNGRNRIEKL